MLPYVFVICFMFFVFVFLILWHLFIHLFFIDVFSVSVQCIVFSFKIFILILFILERKMIIIEITFWNIIRPLFHYKLVKPALVLLKSKKINFLTPFFPLVALKWKCPVMWRTPIETGRLWDSGVGVNVLIKSLKTGGARDWMSLPLEKMEIKRWFLNVKKKKSLFVPQLAAFNWR